MKMIQVLITLLLAVFAVKINAGGEQCTAINQQPAICLLLTDCPFLNNLYKNEKSRENAAKLIESQKICGSRANGRNPIVCCPDPNKVVTTTSAPKACVNSNDAQESCILTESSSTLDISTVKGLFTPQQGCGFSNATSHRLSGGSPAKLGAWPWMALLGYKNEFGEVSFKCEGTLISTRHILTAAHCMSEDLALVRLGEHDRNTDTETKFIEIEVARQIMHPNYDKDDRHSDIGILVLNNTITEIGSTIRPICIPVKEPERSKNFVGYNPFVAGWGRTTELGKFSNLLMEEQIPVLKNDECRSRYQELGRTIFAKQFNETVICAGYLRGSRVDCIEDYGAPLMVPTVLNDGIYFHQIGISIGSDEIGCARTDAPGVFTSVQYFADWINETVESS